MTAAETNVHERNAIAAALLDVKQLFNTLKNSFYDFLLS